MMIAGPWELGCRWLLAPTQLTWMHSYLSETNTKTFGTGHLLVLKWVGSVFEHTKNFVESKNKVVSIIILKSS